MNSVDRESLIPRLVLMADDSDGRQQLMSVFIAVGLFRKQGIDAYQMGGMDHLAIPDVEPYMRNPILFSVLSALSEKQQVSRLETVSAEFAIFSGDV